MSIANASSEEIFLSGIMLSPFYLANDFVGMLEVNDFNGPNREIYQSALALAEKGQPTDFQHLQEDLQKAGKFDSIGLNYFLNLIDLAPMQSLLPFHAKRIFSNARKRDFERLMRGGLESLEDSEFQEVLEGTQKGFEKLSLIASQDEDLSFKQVILDECHRIDKCADLKGVTGISTGFEKLDKFTSGFHGGELIIIAGRPAMGKTAFALNIGLNVAKQKKAVGFFSLEMAPSQLVQRLFALETNIDASSIRNGQILKESWAKLFQKAEELSQLPVFISGKTDLSPHKIKAICRKWKSMHQLELVIVDYLQLISVPGKENREREIGEISRALKTISIELDIPVIALSQLNRNLENRGMDEKRPRLSDLRESGSLEQDADLVLFLYRPEVYHETVENKGLCEIIVGKQRSGPVGNFDLRFSAETTRFSNI